MATIHKLQEDVHEQMRTHAVAVGPIDAQEVLMTDPRGTMSPAQVVEAKLWETLAEDGKRGPGPDTVA